MGRLLDQKSVDKDGRWVVIDPVLMEILMDEDSRFLNSDFGDSGALRNGLVINNWNSMFWNINWSFVGMLSLNLFLSNFLFL